MFKQISSLLLLLLACSDLIAADTRIAEDEAKVASTIEAIGLFVDQGEFSAICNLYSPWSRSDYSSLWGNGPRYGDPSSRVAGWSAFIPGFDTTRHEIAINRVSISKDTADATADVIASHWLEGNIWKIWGTYDVSLERSGERWLIADWTFQLKKEIGLRSLVDDAEHRAIAAAGKPVRCSAAVVPEP